mmetsp:Transcript_17143/g.56090  ORF Transcript_17143/g.56090 Transcript_17143/m.56090 type:complete len:206 (-) Transcript_17143:1263-1880(-)
MRWIPPSSIGMPVPARTRMKEMKNGALAGTKVPRASTTSEKEMFSKACVSVSSSVLTIDDPKKTSSTWMAKSRDDIPRWSSPTLMAPSRRPMMLNRKGVRDKNKTSTAPGTYPMMSEVSSGFRRRIGRTMGTFLDRFSTVASEVTKPTGTRKNMVRSADRMVATARRMARSQPRSWRLAHTISLGAGAASATKASPLMHRLPCTH